MDLRHLGSKRVLVLVDGLRWVNESSASGIGAAVDLNTIPLAAIDRIEILEDGASSIYGSDAIAGVVNIITRRDFDGAQATSYWGRFGEGDGETTNAELAWGGATRALRASSSGASFVEQKRVSSGDREQSRFPVPGTGRGARQLGDSGRAVHLHRPPHRPAHGPRAERRGAQPALQRSAGLQPHRRLPLLHQRRPLQLRALQPARHPLQAQQPLRPGSLSARATP
ncbi:MAG: TonB-dependent receptor plug domain-containing protein [Xanthomonadales bacterium]|nr:TonB-dependent receptor plug domain-containing protein [Xanthomonadales bacterium]